MNDAISPREPQAAARPPRPAWAEGIALGYESGASSQFILHGNVADRFPLPRTAGGEDSGTLTDYVVTSLLARFDVVLTYDVGNGARVAKGGDAFAQWPHWKQDQTLPKAPRAAVEWLTHYARYAANLARLGQRRLQVAIVVSDAQLVAPATQGFSSFEVAALAVLMRDWASDGLLSGHSLATFLIADALSDLHPLVATNPRAQVVQVPLPDATALESALRDLARECPAALAPFASDFARPARALVGATLSSVDGMVRTRQHKAQPLAERDLAEAKKRLIEADAGGLIEFIDSKKTLDDLAGMERVKTWVRQDIALWRQDDLQAMPMGYLICGPVGTGKTFTVECLAGEAGVPVVKLKNFRDKWVGSTEGNLEKIFRLVRALGRCYVFVDEADQSLGKRESGGNDGGIGGRVYAMLAQEMSDTRNRGKVLWILASSRPDLIEVDLKRPGRIDVKIPLLPTATADESWALIVSLCRRRGLELPAQPSTELRILVPTWLTPGAAESLAVKAYRVHRVEKKDPLAAVEACLRDWRAPVPRETMQFQIGIAVAEASDATFVPEAFRA
ncbi:MAG: ATP-binding protein [Planctomycetes bacterium]|nr:ATP-binding protein [Planctomycetota bacterium]